MSSIKPVTIVGGGLAGLTLGIGLRQYSVPVVILEAGRYPRHRVCGEFISGRGQQTLRRLGLFEPICRAGALPAGSVDFFSTERRFATKILKDPALCLSRYVLDALLAEKFCELGGTLRCDSRWRQEKSGEGIVRATGRRPHPTDGNWRWFGLKAHARNVVLSADLEMHLGKDSYVGLCRLPDGETNVCGLFRRAKSDATGPHDPVERLCGEPGSWLYERLRAAKWDDESFCAVGGLSFMPHRAAASMECQLGDALTMTPPITGNGMSMAFEAAEFALKPLLSYANGEACWTATQQRIAKRCDVAFVWRLRWASLLHSAVLQFPHSGFLKIFLGSNILWRLAFSTTR